jgi:hypothetical protein
VKKRHSAGDEVGLPADYASPGRHTRRSICKGMPFWLCSRFTSRVVGKPKTLATFGKAVVGDYFKEPAELKRIEVPGLKPIHSRWDDQPATKECGSHSLRAMR